MRQLYLNQACCVTRILDLSLRNRQGPVPPVAKSVAVIAPIQGAKRGTKSKCENVGFDLPKISVKSVVFMAVSLSCAAVCANQTRSSRGAVDCPGGADVSQTI